VAQKALYLGGIGLGVLASDPVVRYIAGKLVQLQGNHQTLLASHATEELDLFCRRAVAGSITSHQANSQPPIISKLYHSESEHELDGNFLRGAAGGFSGEFFPQRHRLGDSLKHRLRINPWRLGHKIGRHRKFEGDVILVRRGRRTFSHTTQM
jgi:hypothetical protein